MSGSTILREYLLSLGFKVNTQEQKKFDAATSSTGKGALVAGLSVGALATTIALLAEQYAKAMEKMYYASRKGGGTVAQLQAMEFAGEKVGLAAGTMTAAVTTMASKLRMNAGLIGLLGKLGVQTRGRTPAQEMMDLIDKTSSMQYNKGASIAALFGLDEGTYQVLRQNREEFRAAMEEQERMNKAGKVDVDANAKAVAEWEKNVTSLKASFTMLEGSLQAKLLPLMEQITAETKKTMIGLTQDLQAAEGFWDFVFKRGDRAEKEGTAAGLPWDPDSAGSINIDTGSLANKVRRWAVGLGHEGDPGYVDRKLGPDPYATTGSPTGGGGPGTDVAAAGNGFASQADRYAAIEKMWRLTPGTLQSLRNIESNDGKNMGTGKKNALGLGGIIGDFQMDPDARRKYGVTNPFDEADAAGEMFSDLKKVYGTDAKAAAAWNGGTAAGKYGPSHGVNPAETEAFVPKFMSGINQTNNITVNGGGTEVTGAVKQGLASANGDLIRNLKTVVQ